MELFRALHNALGSLPIVAEDLGEMFDSVRELLAESGFPGMNDYINKITEISVDGTVWDKTDYAIALYGRKAYYPDSSNNRVVFDSTVLHTGNVITIKSDGYKELYLKVTAEGNDFTVVAPRERIQSQKNFFQH